MQSKQMRKHATHHIISWCLTLSLCCNVSDLTQLSLKFNNYPMSKVYASELTNYIDSDLRLSEQITKTDVFEEAHDSAISIQNDEKNELEIAIMRKQNTQPIMTSAYTILDETASKGAIDAEKATEQKRLQEEKDAKKLVKSVSSDSNATFDYSEKVSAPQESHITETGGIYQGPSGHETYYNLPMDGVITIMRNIGYSESDGWIYWVRDDGVKMFGDYVMVAADLDVRPRGSLIECSMGTAIVCDTGDFAKSNAYQLDIAVTW